MKGEKCERGVMEGRVRREPARFYCVASRCVVYLWSAAYLVLVGCSRPVCVCVCVHV